MYASLQLAPGFLSAALAAPAVSQALLQGSLTDNLPLAESLRHFDIANASGLRSVLSDPQISRLQQLQDGLLSPEHLGEARIALARLELAGEAVTYHSHGRPGKVSVAATKPFRSLADLKKAYSPGVAYASRLIRHETRYEALLTNVMNSVAVVSDGSTCLGDGALGPYAFHPIGEGKGGIMLVMAGLDAHSQPREWPGFEEIYVKETASPEMIERYVARAVDDIMAMRPAYGAFNLEDISNKTCFQILERLQEKINRLIWHDDQQGTAMVTVAGLLAALKIQGKYSREAIRDLKIAIAGAGAAGIVCGRLIRQALRRICPEFRDNQIIMKDSRGLISKSRQGLSREKAQFAVDSDRTFEHLLETGGYDVFIGVSPVGTFKMTPDQVKGMREKPIIFALANPDPEILPEQVDEIRSDAVVFTGRSDRRNQANNSNAFPGTLAGGLDVGARLSTDDMALAGAFAMAEIPFEPVLSDVQSLFSYPLIPGDPNYAVASAFDPRVHYRVAEAVAREAVRSGVAAFPFDNEGYAEWFLRNRLKNAFVTPSSAGILIKQGLSLFSDREAA